MAKDPLIYIDHIKESIEEMIISYTEDLNEDSYYENQLIQDAVIRHF